MKTSMDRVVSGGKSAGFAVLHWDAEPAATRLGGALSRRPVKVPVLRIMTAVEKGDLFKYASGAKARSGAWETVVFAALAVSAVGAVAITFFGS